MPLVRAAAPALLALALAGCGGAPPAPSVSPAAPAAAEATPARSLAEWTLAEQLSQNVFDYGRLSDSIPGFGGMGPRSSCEVVVYVTDPAAHGEVARRILRPTVGRTPAQCEREQEVRVLPSRYTYEELSALARRVLDALHHAGVVLRGGLGVQVPDTVLLQTVNERELGDLRAFLARLDLPPDVVRLVLFPGPQELDDPIPPPPAAYLAVLDTVAAYVREASEPVLIDPARLPAQVLEGGLAARGLRALEPADECRVPRVSFPRWRQLDDGTYEIMTVEERVPRTPAISYTYRVRCDGDMCRVVAPALGFGDIFRGCR